MTYNFKTLIICSLLVGKWLFQLRLTEQKLPKPAFVWIHECLSISLSFEMHRGCKHTLMMRNFITAACWATSLQTTEDWPHCSGPMGSSRFKSWTEGLSPPSLSLSVPLSLTHKPARETAVLIWVVGCAPPTKRRGGVSEGVRLMDERFIASAQNKEMSSGQAAREDIS